MASLIEFHKYIGYRLDPGPKDIKKYWDESKVNLYKQYLQDVLKMPCEDNGIWSHFGPNAFRWNGKFGNDTFQPKIKVKKVTISQWLVKNHPEILKEYRKEVTNA